MFEPLPASRRPEMRAHGLGAILAAAYFRRHGSWQYAIVKQFGRWYTPAHIMDGWTWKLPLGIRRRG